MIRNVIAAVVMMGIAPLLTHCATQQDVQNLDFRMRYMDNKLVDMTREMNKIANRPDIASKSTVDQVQKQQAGIGDNVERLQADILQAMSALDENNHKMETMRAETGRQIDALNTQITDLTKINELLSAKIDKQQEELNEVKIARAKEATERAIAAAKEAELAKAKALASKQQDSVRQIEPNKTKVAKSGETNTEIKVKSSSEPGKELYDSAYALYVTKKYDQAYRTFTKYIDDYPKGSLVPNARFWLADSLYNQNEFELAIFEYQKVIDNFPKHEKAPAALLKEGLAFEKLKDNVTAKIVYEKLLADYPKSEQVATAHERLKNL